ncbi:LacI family DNA-binding transcriptional regulator [Pediococcus ethanolidurans]
MVKLSDVADLAKVSVTTVSRVINNYGSLSQKTKDKVWSAINELNYQPNNLARSLQGKKTQLIGLIFPGVSNPFFGELVQTLENQLFDKGYRVILCNSANNAEKERAYLRMLSANQVDGIITGTHNLGIEEYEKVSVPIVSSDRHLGDHIPIVTSNNYQGGRLATTSLVNTGSKKITIITGANSPENPTNERLQGYLDILKKNKLSTNELELPFSMTPQLKRIAIKDLLMNEHPDAIFCTDDLNAILVSDIATEEHIKIPQQLKLIGYDGTQFIQQYYPKLATVIQPIAEISALLIDLLLKQIDDPAITLDKLYSLPVKLQISESLLA